MITRTFTTTIAKLMTVNNMEVDVLTVRIAGKLTEKEVEKTVRKNKDKYIGKSFFVNVDSIEYATNLYGMDEDIFLKYAVELDENRKIKEVEG